MVSQDDSSAQAVRILLVDDDPDLLESMSTMLRRRGYEVLEALDAEKALLLIGRSRPGLVLTDLRLPGKSGLDLLREVHAADPALPVIIMTAYGSDEVVDLASRFGAYTVLTKPVLKDQLLRTLGGALGT